MWGSLYSVSYVEVDIWLVPAYNIGIKKHCDKRLASVDSISKNCLNNRHFAEWRLLLFTIIVMPL